MLSDDYQTIMAKAGLTPAKSSLASLLGDDEYAQATIAAASNAKLTPAAPGWATVEGSRVLEDLFSAIAQGGDVNKGVRTEKGGGFFRGLRHMRAAEDNQSLRLGGFEGLGDRQAAADVPAIAAEARDLHA